MGAPVKPGNSGSPDNPKADIESLSGMSLDGVKVQPNSSKPAQLSADAYAQDRAQAPRQMKSNVPINDDQGLEHEADVMGAKAAAMGATSFQAKESGGSNAPLSSDPAGTAQLRLLEEADGFDNLNLRDTGETFSVIGQYPNSDAKLYADNTVLEAADKAGAIAGIAERAGEIGQGLSDMGGYTTDAEKFDDGDETTIDPFTHCSYSQLADGKYVLMMYQHTHDLDGYVTGIEEGTAGDGGQYTASFQESMRYGQTRVETSMGNSERTYSQLHDKTVDRSLITIASGSSAGKADAMTKLAGEGARFQWVRNNIATMTDTTEFAVPAKDRKPALSIYFRDLWATWKNWFNGQYNIPDQTIRDTLYAKGHATPVSKEAKNRLFFNGTDYPG